MYPDDEENELSGEPEAFDENLDEEDKETY